MQSGAVTQQVTDMILTVSALREPIDLLTVDLDLDVEDIDSVLAFLRAEHPAFLPYYAEPAHGSTIYSASQNDQIVAVWLLEELAADAETGSDGAIGALVVARSCRGRGIGSAAIVRCCQELRLRGFVRVIASWVASVGLYERLGFHVWRTRMIHGSEDKP